MLSTVEVLNNIGSLVPNIYLMLRVGFGLAGVITAYSGIRILINNQSGSPAQKPKSTGLFIVIIGAFMFTTGTLLTGGNFEITGTYVNYSRLESYTPLTTGDTSDVAIYVANHYIRLISYIFAFVCLYTIKNGLKYDEKGWGVKALSFFILGILFLGVAKFSNGLGELFGFPTLGTDYFSF
jgi:hypothetical protein